MSQNAKANNPGCLGSILNLFGRNSGNQKLKDVSVDHLPADTEAYPYRLRDDFLSPAEKSFYQVLKGMTAQQFTICTKVNLADIFFVTRPNENISAHNRINRKHIDFLICEPETMTPMFAIELDDSSHNRQDRVDRDDFVDCVFDAADLPLLRIPVRAGYNTNELGTLFKKAIQERKHSIEAEAQDLVPTQAAITQNPTPIKDIDREIAIQNLVPNCPKCGTTMVLRTARSGDQAGRKFYGCVNYPKCRVILPFEESK